MTASASETTPPAPTLPGPPPGFAPRRERLLERLRAPAPRAPLPPDIRNAARDPQARLFILLGTVLGTMTFLMTVIHPVIGWMNNRPLPLAFVVPMFALGFLPLLGMGMYGRSRERKIHLLLTSGHLVKGRIRSVKKTFGQNGGQTFARVRVEIAAPGLGHVEGVDTIDQAHAAFFIDARDTDREVDVLHHPDAGANVLLPDRIALAQLFD